jgi:ribosome maturation factor RimP
LPAFFVSQNMSDLEQKITDIIEAPLHEMGFNIVRLKLLNKADANSGTKILEILIERLDEERVSIGDCAQASRHMSALLDVEDVIEGRYNLEVAGAGVERPLVKLQDFDKFKGYVVGIKLHKTIKESKKHQGKLEGTNGNLVMLAIKDEILNIEFDNIKDAKLVLTDELFRKLVK